MSDIRKFIRRYAARYWRWYALGLVALAATNGLSVLIPVFLQRALAAVDPATGDGHLLRWVVLILGASLGIIVVRTASRLLVFIPGREAEFHLRNDYFRHLLSLQPAFFRTTTLGDLMSRGSNDVQFVRVLVGFAGLQLLNIAFALPLNLWMMIRLSPSLALACVLPLAIAAWVMRVGISRMMTRMRQSQEELAALSDEVLESYNGVRVVQSYAAEGAMLARFDERNERYMALLVDIGYLRSFFLPIVTVVGNLSILALLWLGGRMVAEGSLHFSAISAFAVYVGNIVGAMLGLGWVVNVIQRGRISLRRLMTILDTEPDLPPVQADLPEGPLDLTVSGLTFTYPVTGKAPVLEDVSFRVPAGTMLGVFGHTGSGKTTLVRLITRLETPPAGAVRLGGVDVRDVALPELRSALGVVPQNPYLFGRSLRENVALGAPGGEAPDPERVEQVVRQAQLAGDLPALPQGLDTLVGERGVTLSGGQRQRAALARAFYRDARVLVLDDALSAVDHETELRLIEAIRERARGHTVVFVSHRVSALRHADHVIVLEHGRIAQQGEPGALLRQGGPFAEAWALEERGDEAAVDERLEEAIGGRR